MIWNKFPIFRATLLAAGLKAYASILSVIFTFVVARLLGASEAGLVFLAMTVLTLGGAIFRLGFEAIVLREFGRQVDGLSAFNITNVALAWISIISVPICIGLYIFRNDISADIFHKVGFSDVLGLIVIAIPLMATFQLLSFAYQGQKKIFNAIFLQNMAYLSFATVGLLVVNKLYPQSLNSRTTACVVLASISLTWLYAFISWCRRNFLSISISDLIDKELFSSGGQLWLANLSTLGIAWSGVIACGVFLEAEQIAFLSTAQRLALVICFSLLVCDVVMAPRYASLYAKQDLTTMRLFAQRATIAMLVIVSPLMLLILMFSEEIMGLFGAGFERGALYLIVLSFAQLVNVATGSVGQLLTMSGFEKDYRNITMGIALAFVPLIVIATKVIGGNGTVIMTACAIVSQNVFGAFMVKKRLGFWPGL